MTIELDETHDPALRSWVHSANANSDFPIQNLPLGIFDPGDGRPRGGVAIGDRVVDLGGLAAANLLSGDALTAAQAASSASLNRLMSLGAGPRRALRHQLSSLLAAGRSSPLQPATDALLHDTRRIRMHLPASIGDYTDFYAGIHHASNVGRLFRPDNPLLPNYKYVPIGYHGRASSVRPSGAPVHWPRGQLKSAQASAPVLDLSQRLDYELELALWIATGNELGQRIDIAHASDHLFGVGLLNDWSARDIQAWEYQPLGPFLAKNFVTTVSPWIVTMEALAPFRTALRQRPAGDPEPLPYLLDPHDQVHGAFNITLHVAIQTAAMRSHGLPHHSLAHANATALYWTAAQLITHHTINGCNLRPGDLLGTGTISEPRPDRVGSLLELSQGGSSPVALPSGETRTFLREGDEIAMTARAETPGYVSIGFGPCLGRVLKET